MVPTVSDRRYETNFVQQKYQKYKANTSSANKSQVHFDLKMVEEASFCMSKNDECEMREWNDFVNCMEKLSMNNPQETLQARMVGAMNAGVDGITLSAGLHLSTMALSMIILDLGYIFGNHCLICSSSPSILKRAAKFDRMPDYIVVEGPNTVVT